MYTRLIVAYRPDPKHGNTDAMSRCVIIEIVRDCPQTYPLLEYLKYGPGVQCTKRAHDMASSMKMRPYIV